MVKSLRLMWSDPVSFSSKTIRQPLIRKPLVGSVALCLLLAGCGGPPKPEGLPKLYSTTIQLTQAGDPCEEASVRLVPELQSNWPVGGSTDATGTVTLKTYGKYPGAPEGKYKVVVSKVERQPVGSASSSMYEVQKEVVYDLVNPIYSTPEGTPLEIEIRPGKNVFGPFDLGTRIHQKVKKPGE